MNPGRIYSMIKCFGLGSFKKIKNFLLKERSSPCPINRKEDFLG
jgi:hypothetical protein